MKPVRTPATTTVLAAPAGWDEAADGECLGLPIAEAHGTMFSYWSPTWRERIAVLFGSPIRLGVFGRGHPPVTLDTLN